MRRKGVRTFEIVVKNVADNFNFKFPLETRLLIVRAATSCKIAISEAKRLEPFLVSDN